MTEKTATVFGLAHRCPFGSRQQECPLLDTRGIPLRDRYDIITRLSPDQLNDITEFHKNCCAQREET